MVGATVTVTDTSKGTSTTVETNASGEYTAQHLIPDLYDIKVESKSYRTCESHGIQVSADTRLR